MGEHNTTAVLSFYELATSVIHFLFLLNFECAAVYYTSIYGTTVSVCIQTRVYQCRRYNSILWWHGTIFTQSLNCIILSVAIGVFVFGCYLTKMIHVNILALITLKQKSDITMFGLEKYMEYFSKMNSVRIIIQTSVL